MEMPVISPEQDRLETWLPQLRDVTGGLSENA